jgi:hypothetical protein
MCMEEYLGQLDTYSPSTSARQKRRGSSRPDGEGLSLHSAGNAVNLSRCHEAASQAPPITTQVHSTSESVSSNSSAPIYNSYASIMFSSSDGRLSPLNMSPGGTDISDSPYISSVSLDSSPISMCRQNHQRTPLRSKVNPP